MLEEYKCNNCEQIKAKEFFYKNNKSKAGTPRQPCKCCTKERERIKRAEYQELLKIVPDFKICSVCQQEKPKEDFPKRSDTPTGLRSDCKECYNLKSREYYEDNSEKVNKRTSEYQKLHKDENARRKREKYQADPEKHRELDRQYRKENKDKLNAAARKRRSKNVEKYRRQYKEYYYANTDKMKKYRKQWASRNKDKVAYYAAERRAKRKQATPDWADQEVIKSFYKEAQYFGESIDHIIPLSNQLVCGLHCEFNLQLLPLTDNIIKNNNFEICEHELPEFLSEEDFE